ncbi:hypothetical protein VE04_08490, partial [Pseudogymnoascus sp. 24MN13]
MPPPHPPSLPSPPSTDNDVTHKKAAKRTKSSKPGPRGPKRVTAAAAPSGSRSPEMGDGRHKRVWKACERCRMKKTKCDGESPSSAAATTASSAQPATGRRRNSNSSPVDTRRSWRTPSTLSSPQSTSSTPWYSQANNGRSTRPVVIARGQPVIHDIAAKLGCIRADPSSSTSGGAIEFPADAAEFAALQRRLESEERGSSGEMGVLSAVTGPESQFGDDSFCEDFDPGFEMEDDFPDVDGTGYGDMSPFSDGPGGFGMDGLQSLQQGGYEEFIPASSSSPALPTAA